MDRRRLLILPYLFWLLGLVLAPFLIVLSASLARQNEAGLLDFAWSLDSFRALVDPLYFQILLRTLGMAGLHSLLTLLIAYPAAFYLSRLPRREGMIWLTLFLVPFWTNYLIRLLAFMDVLRLQPFWLQWTFSFRGILAALVYNYLPFAVLPLYSALAKVPNSLIEAAFDLGAGRRQIFLRLLWPLTKNAVCATFLLIFIPSLGEFLIPELVGGGQSFFMGTFLQQQFLTFRNWPLGSAAVALLFGLALLTLVLGGRSLMEDEG